MEVIVKTPEDEILFHEEILDPANKEQQGKLMQLESRVMISATMIFEEDKTVSELHEIDVMQAVKQTTVLVK